MARKGRKKVNPNRQPVSQADVKRAKQAAVVEAVSAAWAIFFTVLRDKEGYSEEDLRRVWDAVESLSEEVEEGRITVSDLRHTLKEEAGIFMEGV